MVAAGADNGAATVTFTNLQTYTIFVTTSYVDVDTFFHDPD